MFKFPNLFLVGSGKCGTTTLYNYLNQHPGVFMSNPKEPAYFCKDFHKESDEFHNKQNFFFYRTEQEYMKLFSAVKNQKVIGEASTLYFPSKVAAKNIYEFNPEAKIIITIRNPIDLLYSVHGEYMLIFRENINDFAEALAVEKQRRNGENIPKTIPAPSLLFYSEKVKFSNCISRYIEMFGRDRVKVIIYEEFRENNFEVVHDVFNFIDVDPKINIEFKTYRASRKIRPRFLRTLLASPSLSQAPKKLIKGSLYFKLRSSLYKIITKDELRPKLQPQLRKELMRKNKEEVEKVGSLLNRNLVKLWGYENINNI